MKKLLLIVVIVIIVACVFSLLYAALNQYGYKNLLDGTPEHYRRLHQKAVGFSVFGIILALLGSACIFFYFKFFRGN